MIVPDTKPSLLLRLRDSEDREAWELFSRSYWQVIYRLALVYGLQPADAEDLCQKVFMSVNRSIDSYVPQSGKAKFRTWLKAIAKNEIINTLERDPRTRGREISLDPTHHETTAFHDSKSHFELSYRREVFFVAAEMARPEFSSRTWQAFWLTAVDEHSIESTCEQLEMTRGSLYAARCRVIRRLREIVEQLEDKHE